MGAFWNPRGGVVLGDKELTKKELSDLKGRWLEHLPISVSPVVKWWKKFKMAIILFTPLR